jgi:hypothetical protein
VLIDGNTASGHVSPAVDLADDAADCADTLWQNNTFATASTACIH